MECHLCWRLHGWFISSSRCVCDVVWWWVWLWCVDDSTTHSPIHLLLNTAGPKAIARNALVGGILLALIEGVGIMIQKFSAEQMQGNATTPQSLSLLSDCLADDVAPCPSLPSLPSYPSYPSAAQQMAAGAAPQDMLAPPTAPPSYSSSSSGPSAESAGFAEGACAGCSTPFFLVTILTDLPVGACVCVPTGGLDIDAMTAEGSSGRY